VCCHSSLGVAGFPRKLTRPLSEPLRRQGQGPAPRESRHLICHPRRPGLRGAKELGSRDRMSSPCPSRQVLFQQARIHDERAIAPIADEPSFAKLAQCHRHMRPTHRGHLRKFLMAHLQGYLPGKFCFNSTPPGGELQQQSSEPCLRPAMREHLGASLRFSESNTHADHEGQECISGVLRY
jgi:hypothetical protein